METNSAPGVSNLTVYKVSREHPDDTRRKVHVGYFRTAESAEAAVKADAEDLDLDPGLYSITPVEVKP